MPAKVAFNEPDLSDVHFKGRILEGLDKGSVRPENIAVRIRLHAGVFVLL
ncbi:hypothetical protein SDC9_206292 [bioreactor metagenome]|uniref:Uncharacterized protein n=1 Tax=bioreactor metagenome TaxID=1076179 RepID=A0A645J4F3_9ZZZZ